MTYIAGGSASVRTHSHRCRTGALLLMLAVFGGVSWVPPARSATPPDLIVIPRPVSGAGISYFKLRAQPGGDEQAGAVELRNPSAKPMPVVLAGVDGLTINTLGSAYAQAGSKAHGSTLWLHLGGRRLTLPPGGRAVVPVSIRVPRTAQPGDYLSGVSIEALDQQQSTPAAHGTPAVPARPGVSIASVSRYVIGVEVSLPGPRHPLIQLTGAQLQRQPAGLMFLLMARNAGNVILQGVQGWVRVTRAGHTILSRAIEAGTFVTGTSIAYPVPAFSQDPTEGTRYRITAGLRYSGGVTQLNTSVSLSHREAVIQQHYGGYAAATVGGTAWWKIALLVAAILYGAVTTSLLLRRRKGHRQ